MNIIFFYDNIFSIRFFYHLFLRKSMKLFDSNILLVIFFYLIKIFISTIIASTNNLFLNI